MLDPQEDTMAKRHLTPAEIDHVAQRAHLGPQRRAALATTRVPADAPTAKLVDVLVDIERTLIALGRHLGPPRVCEIRRRGAGGAADTEVR
jgi:hypothetical protein